MKDVDYAITQRLAGVSVAEAERRVRETLAAEGFGILTEIDVQATLKKKLGVNLRPYKILGACNPTYAHRALEIEPAVGVFLPCNVDVLEDETGTTLLQAVRPDQMMEVARNPELAPIAAEIQARLSRALAAAAGPR